jgi:hypothetical protein
MFFHDSRFANCEFISNVVKNRTGNTITKVSLATHRLKQQRHPVHAVAQTRWLRAVGEYMAEVRVADGATNFGAVAVGFGVNSIGDDGGKETWPARIGVKLGLGCE